MLFEMWGNKIQALCLLPLLTGCAGTRTVYVPVPVIPLPANLTAETPQPVIPDPLTYGGSLDLNVSLLSALAACNSDKADIRKIEAERSWPLSCKAERPQQVVSMQQ